MKLAVISDIHDNLANLSKCLEWCKMEKIERIICCGDITNSETLKFLAENFSGQIYLVYGNIELYDKKEIEKYQNINYLGRTGKITLNSKKIGVCHEPYLVNKLLKEDNFNIIFYGHTHRPWISAKNGVKLVNVGTLGGVFQKATFAVWDTKIKEPELKILEDI
jgi:putative phosphoesterase